MPCIEEYSKQISTTSWGLEENFLPGPALMIKISVCSQSKSTRGTYSSRRIQEQVAILLYCRKNLNFLTYSPNLYYSVFVPITVHWNFHHCHNLDCCCRVTFSLTAILIFWVWLVYCCCHLDPFWKKQGLWDHAWPSWITIRDPELETTERDLSNWKLQRSGRIQYSHHYCTLQLSQADRQPKDWI